MVYFEYGETELSYLRQKDRRLGEVIDRIGHIDRAVDTDLFSAIVHHIIGQQISTKAQATIWQRMRDALGEVNAENILAAGVPELQALGMTFRKAEYITDLAQKARDGAFDLDGIWQKTDGEVIRELSSLKGVGIWTAEMILLFCMQRPDVLVTTIWLFSADCGCSITTAALTVSGLRYTAVGLARMAAWRACICGRWPAERYRS